MLSSSELDFIFLGTGPSSSLPLIHCVTQPEESSQPPCDACLSTLNPHGRKNARRNTGAVVRARRPDSADDAVIVIDVGKTFIQAALEWFPRYGLRKIDAVIITHGHADAMNGLDDLRGWTLGSDIQQSIDIYLSVATYHEVTKAFPYLVTKGSSTGSGAVPELQWHIIEDGVPFDIKDGAFTITPTNVHHGRHFGSCKPTAPFPITPDSSHPPSPARSSSPEPEVIQPYTSFGFVLNSAILYISDASHIPDSAWDVINQYNFDVLVVDCLKVNPIGSHFGIAEAFDTARKVNAKRAYMTGLTHDLTHDEWVTVGEVLGGDLAIAPEGRVKEAIQRVDSVVAGDKDTWIRPAYDGLRLRLQNGQLLDEDN